MIRFESAEAQGQVNFVGLMPSVVYRMEIGFAVVDDGERLFRIRQSAFEQVVAEAEIDAAAAGPELGQLVQQHASIFKLFDDPGAARSTLVDREL